MLSKPGTSTFSEITEQPQSWREVLAEMEGRRGSLAAWLKAENFGQVMLLGCGTSYHVGLSAARVLHAVTGLNAHAFPASEVLAAPRPPYDVRIKTLVVAISRSGETSETLWAMEKLKGLDARAKVLAVTCKKESELAPLAHQTVAFPGLHEEAPIATRSHTGTLLALQVMAGWMAGNEAFLAELAQLPDRLEIKKFQTEIQKAVALKSQHITFLGTGPRYGLAAASSLLMREMGALSSDFMHLLEFRHGAQASVLPHTLIVAYLSDGMRKAEEDMIREVAVMRGPRMVICSEADIRTKMGTEYVFELGTDIGELARLVLDAPIGQLLAFYTAISKAYNPDRPKHVQAVVKMKEKPGA